MQEFQGWLVWEPSGEQTIQSSGCKLTLEKKWPFHVFRFHVKMKKRNFRKVPGLFFTGMEDTLIFN